MKATRSSVTVKDIARESGLSLSTVIHILGGRADRYRAETRERVMEVAGQLGYRRNSSARAMRRGRFDCVALLMSAEPNRTLLRQPALEGICDALAEQGLHLSVARFAEEALVNEKFVPKMLREWTADGLLVAFAVSIPPRMVQLIEGSRLPCVWMRSRRASDCVYLDESDAARRAVDHLARLGHRRIAFADYTFGQEDLPQAHYGVRDSESGYCRAMRRLGLAPRVIREPVRVERSGRIARLRGILAADDRPTAVIAYPSTIWPAAMAAAGLGLQIPADLSLITLSNQPEDVAGLSLATFVTPEYEIGRASAVMLVERIRNPERALPRQALKFGFAEGASCAPPPVP